MSESVREKCPMCGALEIEAGSSRTVYACGSSDYDRRLGTFEQSEICKAANESSECKKHTLLQQCMRVALAKKELTAANLKKCTCSSFVRQYEGRCCCNVGRIQARASIKLKEAVDELVEYVTGELYE